MSLFILNYVKKQVQYSVYSLLTFVFINKVRESLVVIPPMHRLWKVVKEAVNLAFLQEQEEGGLYCGKSQEALQQTNR